MGWHRTHPCRTLGRRADPGPCRRRDERRGDRGTAAVSTTLRDLVTTPPDDGRGVARPGVDRPDGPRTVATLDLVPRRGTAVERSAERRGVRRAAIVADLDTRMVRTGGDSGRIDVRSARARGPRPGPGPRGDGQLRAAVSRADGRRDDRVGPRWYAPTSPARPGCAAVAHSTGPVGRCGSAGSGCSSWTRPRSPSSSGTCSTSTGRGRARRTW